MKTRFSLGGAVRRARVKAGALVADNFFRGLARVGRLHPKSHPSRHNVEVVARDVPYRPGDGGNDHLFDVWRPKGVTGPLPIVFYVHGGAFRILSKDTHWIMALAYARQGYLVFNVSYRLAPRHPFPAAVEDVCEAWRVCMQRAAEWGGDPSRVIVAGESAGANLVTTLTMATCYRRAEPFARAVFDLGIVPSACVPMCGIFQVSDTARFARRRRIPRFIADRLEEVTESYLFGHEHARPEELELADPLVVLERGDRPTRALPPFFTAVGTRDPLLDDTRRLEAALKQLGVVCEAHYYPGELHAYHAIIFRPAARDTWRRTFSFLQRYVAPVAVTSAMTASAAPRR